jgi:arylsulfatase
MARSPGNAWPLVVVTLALLPASCRPAGPAPRSLVVVTVDTLRADRLGSYGSRLGLTPEIDALAAKSVRFDRAYTPIPLTFPSLVALFTGRHPEDVGVDSNELLRDPSVGTLATALAARGYRTGAVVSNFVLRAETGLDRGFEHYDDELPRRGGDRGLSERGAAETTDAALDMLVRLGDGSRVPIFLWVHYQDPHGPYLPPRGYRARYLAAERAAPDAERRLPVSRSESGSGAIPRYQLIDAERRVAFYRAGYHGEVRHVDEEIGQLLRKLGSLGLIDRAVLVFAADHGEGLGEADYWFAHGERLVDSQVRVPLLVRVPGRPAGSRSEAVSLADVAPTLAALLDVPLPGPLRGRDLFAADRESTLHLATPGESPVTRFGVIEGGYKYVVTHDEGGHIERLYRLGDESRDLAGTHPELVNSLAERVRERRGEVKPKSPKRQRVLSPEERRRLRALGYLDGE